MDTLQWSQENRAISIPCGKQSSSSSPEKEGNKDEKHGINCRRCSSTNTKFCYYNNYSLSQPRYFCKTCKRYWTEGGSLRNIPVGGVSRKNMKRISPSESSSSESSSSSPPHPSSKKMLLQLQTPLHAPPPPPLPLPPHQNHDIRIEEESRHDLNLLGLNPSEQSNVFKTISDLIQVPDFDKNDTLDTNNNPNNPNNYLFMPTFHHQLGSFHDEEEDNMMRRAAMLFPFQEIKQAERKSSDAAGGYRINGGFLGSGLW